MVNTAELRESLLEVLKKEQYDLNEIIELLSPLNRFINNENFNTQLEEVVEIILKDRNGDEKFTLDDLDLLRRDVIGVSSLVSSLLLVLGTLPDVKLQYDKEATQELILKLLVYIFLVRIPARGKSNLSMEEKELLLNLVLSLFKVIVSSQVTQDAFTKIANWLKSRKWFEKCRCKCCGGESEAQRRERIVREKMPLVAMDLQNSVQNNKEKLQMKVEMKELHLELNKLKE